MTAWRWGQVLGYINVAFEAGSGGRVLAYEGGPITMDSSTPQQPEFQAKVDAWRAPFDSYSKEVVGWTEGILDQTMCQKGECGSACFGFNSQTHEDSDFQQAHLGT